MCIGGDNPLRPNTQSSKAMFYQHSIGQVKGALFFQALFGNNSRTYNADAIREADTFNQGEGDEFDALNLDQTGEHSPKNIMFDMEKGTYLEVDQSGRKNYFTLNGFERTIAAEGHTTTMNIMGTSGANRIETGDANDQIQGRAGADALLGHGGNDHLWGGADDDWLTGGTGVDHVWGGSGNDTFVMTEGRGYDIVEDFVDGQDKIYIRSIGDLHARNIGANAFVYRDNDLLAVVMGAAGDLELGAGGITLE